MDTDKDEPEPEGITLRITDGDMYESMLDSKNISAMRQISTGRRCMTQQTVDIIKYSEEMDSDDVPIPCWRVIDEKDMIQDEDTDDEEDDEDEEGDDSDEKYNQYYEEVREKCAKLRELDLKIAHEREQEARRQIEEGTTPRKQQRKWHVLIFTFVFPSFLGMNDFYNFLTL